MRYRGVMINPLFAREYDQPVDTTTQVTRIPGTPDAPCHCGQKTCQYPWCKPPEHFPADQGAA